MMGLTDEEGMRKYAPATVVHSVGTLKGFYRWARRRRLVAENPFTRVTQVKQPKKLPKDIYEPEQMQELLSWLSDFAAAATVKERRERYLAHVVAELQYSTGLTIGEVKTLRVEDLDLPRRRVTVYIRTFNKNRTAFLSEYAASVLAVFVNELRPVYLASPNYRNSRHLLFGTSAELTKTVNRVLRQGSAVLGLSFLHHEDVPPRACAAPGESRL